MAVVLNKGQRAIKYKVHDHSISSITVSYIADRINSKRMWLFASGGSRQRRNINRTATMDPKGEIAVDKSGCISHCTSQEAAAKS